MKAQEAYRRTKAWRNIRQKLVSLQDALLIMQIQRTDHLISLEVIRTEYALPRVAVRSTHDLSCCSGSLLRNRAMLNAYSN